MPEGIRGGVRVHWRAAGEAGRRAILAHCSLAHSGAWKGVLERLAPRISMIAFDLPGHGRSADWDGTSHLQDLTVAVARDFLDETPGRVDLIGHSFGATALLALAAEASGRVRSLTLIEPPFFAAVESAPALASQREADKAFEEAFARGDRTAAARAFSDGWGIGLPWDEMPEATRTYMVERIHLLCGSGWVINADRAGVLRPGGLEALSVPVLLLQGERSPGIVSAVFDALESRLPDTRRVVVPGAAHMLPITHPQPVAQAIGAFLVATP